MTKVTIDNDAPSFNYVTATGTTFANAAPITRIAEEMIVLVASSAFAEPRPGVIMPTAAIIGDYVEFHVDPASIDLTTGGQAPVWQVFNEVGDAIFEGSGNGSASFRKVRTTSDHLTWAPIF